MTKRGDVVAIAQECSSTGVFGSGRGTTRHIQFRLAYAISVSRKTGDVLKLRVAGQSWVQRVAIMFRTEVKHISQLGVQECARKLAAAIDAAGGHHWGNLHDFRGAIMAVGDGAPPADVLARSGTQGW
jgi:hypothetical protein